MPTGTRSSRPVFWAAVGCRVVGGLLLLLGATAIALTWREALDLPVALTWAVILTAGVAYVALAHHLVRGRPWAGICGIVLACLTILALVAVVVVEALVLSFFMGPSDVPGTAVIVFAVEGLILVALVWLVVQLWRSVRSIQRARSEVGHGFAVLPVAVVPMASGRTDDPA